MYMDKVVTTRGAAEEVLSASKLLDERHGSPHPVKTVRIYLRSGALGGDGQRPRSLPGSRP
jgi:hypothetical protein